MSIYSYSFAYEPPIAFTSSPQAPQGVFRTLSILWSRTRVRFLFVLLVQAALITASTSYYLARASHSQIIVQKISPSHEEAPSVLGTSKRSNVTPTPTKEPTETPTPTLAPGAPTPTPDISKLLDKHSKGFYKIAIIGDSMVDTMGEVCEYLDTALRKQYPDTKFLLFNYGIGSQTVADGLDRFGKRLDYKSRHYVPLSELQPDIIIVGSFAYNPFTPHDRDRHWLTLTALVQQAQRTGAQVYMLAEIAPLRRNFGRGPQGVNWDPSTAYTHSGRIIEQLENVIGLSKALRVPVFDAYTISLDPNIKDAQGREDLVNPDDGIHPSAKGHEFMSELIAQKIILP